MRHARKTAPNGEDIAVSGFGQRMFRAMLAYAARVGKMPTQTGIGVLVGKELGGPAPHQTTVAAWIKGTVPNDLQTIAAIAKVLGVDPGWLGFGHLTAAEMLPPRTGEP